jgi:methylthioribose-1-phosphate isomerase
VAKTTPAAPVALRWDGRSLHVLDQTALPFREAWIALAGAADTAAAIRRLSVRGAPLIGIVAAYGLAMEVAAQPGLGALERGWEELRDARPTAVNLAWAVDRVRDACLAAGPATIAGVARGTAQAIHAEEDAASAAIAIAGANRLADARRFLTVCNTGALATGGEGSGLAVIREAHRRRRAAGADDVHVLACETRPLLQGARLTVWELERSDIPHALIADGAAAGLIARGEVDAVVTGCDRISADGSVANKVGTYGLALAAAAAGIPFVVAGPTSTVDPATATGADIAIEERDGDEVRTVLGTPITLPGTAVRNPAFDITPPRLVTALVTERGVAEPVNAATVAALAP